MFLGGVGHAPMEIFHYEIAFSGNLTSSRNFHADCTAKSSEFAKLSNSLPYSDEYNTASHS